MTNLKRIIDEKGVRQRWLAEQVGVTEVSMSRYVSGERIPKAPLAIRMADVLGVDVKELYGWDDKHVVGEPAQPETHEERTETHACDCISRQAAIDAFYEMASDIDHLCTVGDYVHVLEMLPSAQPELIRINLNEPIKVKLTDWGKEIYYHQYDRTNQIAGREICKPMFPREDENGYTEFQLWCFIELYGMHMGMTLPNVIEPLEIVYER